MTAVEGLPDLFAPGPMWVPLLDGYDDFPFVPLGSPGLSVPGEDFIEHAVSLAGDADSAPMLERLYRSALYSPTFFLPLKIKGKLKSARFIPGHLWGYRGDALGPRMPGPIDVMIVGKCPGVEEERQCLNMVGENGALLAQVLGELGVSRQIYDRWYITNLVKHANLDLSKKQLTKSWVKNCSLLLEQEIQLLRPKFVLCLGSDASSWMVGEKVPGGVSSLHGRVLTRRIPVQPYGELDYHEFQFMTCLQPVAVQKQSDRRPDLVNTLRRFYQLVTGEMDANERAERRDYKAIWTEEELAATVDQIIAEHASSGWPAQPIAIDCEWHGDYWTSGKRTLHGTLPGGKRTVPAEKGEPESWLRTIQFSHRPGFARAIILRRGGRRDAFGNDDVGMPAFVPSIDAAVRQFKRLMTSTAERKVRVVGQYLKADLPWLRELDSDLGDMLIEAYEPPQDDPDPDGVERLYGWQKLRWEGGFDTLYANHAVQETADRKLEIAAMNVCGMRRYDGDLLNDRKALCDELHVGVKSMGGYGEIRQTVIEDYGCGDADGTIRIFFAMARPGGLLDRDQYGNCSWLPFWISQAKQTAELEMEMAGLLVDQKRAERLTATYAKAYQDLLEKLQDLVGWKPVRDEKNDIVLEGFNPRSVQQARCILFGPELAGKVDNTTGEALDPRPEFASNCLVLNLRPIKTTGKPSKGWDKVVAKKQEDAFSPSTDKETLGILLARAIVANDDQAADVLRTLRWYRFINRVTTGVLCPPKDGSACYYDEDGDIVFEKGAMAAVEWDRHVRTHYTPVDTGRVGSFNFALQNISKRREKDLKDILRSEYTHPLRSIFTVEDGWILDETDFTGAELMSMAIQSGSAKMVDHCLRANLPESNSAHYDIHSRGAQFAFKLDVAPIKSALEAAKLIHLRDIAKCVAAGTRLLTTSGWLLVEDLCGHLAPGQSEKYTGGAKIVSDIGVTPLVGVYNGGVKPCLTVTTDDGHELTTTHEHKYRAVNSDGDYAWRRSADLLVGDWVAVYDDLAPKSQSNTRLPKVSVHRRTSFKPVVFPARFNEDWAAFMGLYLAEGSANPESGMVQLNLATEGEGEREFAEASGRLLGRMFGDRRRQTSVAYEDFQDQARFVVSSTHLARWLHSICPGDSHTKRVPNCVFDWPRYLQAEFLRWLFEGDGSAKSSPRSSRNRGFAISYSTASKLLASDLQILLAGFGVYVRRSEELREGYAHAYQVLTVKYGESRDAFLREIGFFSAVKTGRCISRVDYRLDWSEIPNQEARLRIVQPFLTGLARDKCTECLRVKSPVRLNRTRLSLIVRQLSARMNLPDEADEAKWHLTELYSRPVRFVRVAAVEAAGELQVYDVQTVAPHSVCYNGLVTHQTILFGVPYGRGDEAVMRAIEETGVKVTAKDVAGVRNFIFGNYPELEEFFASCRARVTKPGWIRGCFGRYRRFQITPEENLADVERIAGNFPIQNCVSDALSLALCLLRHYPGRYDSAGRPKYVLSGQIHDAVLTKVRIEHLRWYREKVLPDCMTKGVTIYPCNLDGDRLVGRSGYQLGYESSLYKWWGAKLSRDEGLALGVESDFLPKPRKE